MAWTIRRLLSVGLTMLALSGCRTLSERPTAAPMSFEESLVFYPAPHPEGNWEPTGLVYEDVTFQASDGTALHGWYCPCPGARAVALFAHGNSGNISHRSCALRALQQRFQVSTFAFDYRGYGKSEGVPSEEGILLDARAARDWLCRREKIEPADILLIGESLGGAVAVDLAASDQARGLLLVNTFTCLPDVAACHLPLTPVRRIMKMELNSLEKISAYRGPLLQSHGDKDRIVPYKLGRRLFEAANEPKRLVTIPGGGHNDPPSIEFLHALEEFISTLPKRGALPAERVAQSEAKPAIP